MFSSQVIFVISHSSLPHKFGFAVFYGIEQRNVNFQFNSDKIVILVLNDS